ncbi:MAG: carbohydrate ABC transporter permease [Oscillospiraceae bacterium]|nr:carbohydrate ABC transporter permease [Oscillospiraceae bacterium]
MTVSMGKRAGKPRRRMEQFSAADAAIMIIIVLLCLTCVLPFVHVIAKSLSSSAAVLSKRVFFWPEGFNWDAYTRVLNSSLMVSQLGFTAQITIAQTVLSLVVTALCAYPLSRRYLPGRFVITMIIMVTMYFSAGLIPTYLLYKDIGILNTVWALVLPGAFSAYNMLIMRTYFMTSIPDSLEESAIIDGASHFTVFARIWLPLSKPVFATLALWVAVARWNGYADAMYYTTKRTLQPIQYLLYNMILSARPSESLSGESQIGAALSAPEALQCAVIMFATVPILVIYPFLQKYFVKGVMLGAVKG